MRERKGALSRDTSLEAELVQIEIWREMSTARKFELVGSLNAMVKSLARTGVAERFPGATPEEIEQRLAELYLGADLAARVAQAGSKEKSLMTNEAAEVTLRVTRRLEELRIPYLIGGSLASIAYGEPRSTVDADIVGDLKMEDVDKLVDALGAEFYLNAEAIREAIRHQTSFNLVHYTTTFKVDIFVRKSRPFDDAQFARRRAQAIGENSEQTAQFATECVNRFETTRLRI